MRSIHTVFATLGLLLGTALHAQVKPCKFETLAPSCGPVFTGTDKITVEKQVKTHVLTFTTTKAPATAIGVLAFGGTQVNLPFPGTACTLHLLPAVIVPFNTNAQGEVHKSVAAPADLVITLYLQTAFALGNSTTLSNGLKMTCE